MFWYATAINSHKAYLHVESAEQLQKYCAQGTVHMSIRLHYYNICNKEMININ